MGNRRKGKGTNKVLSEATGNDLLAISERASIGVAPWLRVPPVPQSIEFELFYGDTYAELDAEPKKLLTTGFSYKFDYTGYPQEDNIMNHSEYQKIAMENPIISAEQTVQQKFTHMEETRYGTIGVILCIEALSLPTPATHAGPGADDEIGPFGGGPVWHVSAVLFGGNGHTQPLKNWSPCRRRAVRAALMRNLGGVAEHSVEPHESTSPFNLHLRLPLTEEEQTRLGLAEAK